MGCSLHESIPVVLIEWQRWSCGDRGRGERHRGQQAFTSPAVMRCGAVAVSLSPSLRVSVSGSRRVVGVVVVPGKHVRGRLVPLKALWPLGCRSSARSPALPHPWPGWAAVSVGKASLPVSPAAPPSNSATARPLRGGAAALQPLPNDKPGLRLAQRLRLCRCLLLRFFSTQAHPPCLAPPSRRTASESRLERKGSMCAQLVLSCCCATSAETTSTILF